MKRSGKCCTAGNRFSNDQWDLLAYLPQQRLWLDATKPIWEEAAVKWDKKIGGMRWRGHWWLTLQRPQHITGIGSHNLANQYFDDASCTLPNDLACMSLQQWQAHPMPTRPCNILALLRVPLHQKEKAHGVCQCIPRWYPKVSLSSRVVSSLFGYCPSMLFTTRTIQ
jgi:hypothetical protein